MTAVQPSIEEAERQQRVGSLNTQPLMPSFSRHPLPVDAGHLRTTAVVNADLLKGFGEGQVPR